MPLKFIDRSAEVDAPRLYVLSEAGTLAEAPRAYLIDGSDSEVVYEAPTAPRITLTASPSFGFSGDAGSVRLDYNIQSALAVQQPYSATETLADGTVRNLPITAALRSVLVVPRPAQDAAFALHASNSEGEGVGHAAYDFRTALGGLSATIAGYRTQAGAAQNVQIQPLISLGWTGDPVTAASLDVAGYPQHTARFTNLLARATRNGAVWDANVTFVLPRGDTYQTVRCTLRVTGVTRQNAVTSPPLETFVDIPVPARDGS